jgi:hypothetical protein
MVCANVKHQSQTNEVHAFTIPERAVFGISSNKNIKKCADIREKIPTRHPRQKPNATTGKRETVSREKHAVRKEIYFFHFLRSRKKIMIATICSSKSAIDNMIGTASYSSTALAAGCNKIGRLKERTLQ